MAEWKEGLMFEEAVESWREKVDGKGWCEERWTNASVKLFIQITSQGFSVIKPWNHFCDVFSVLWGMNNAIDPVIFPHQQQQQ